MKNLKSNYLLSLGLIIVFVGFGISFINGCAPSKEVAAKTGVQLWSENCQRCHNTPSPSTFSPEQWETVGMHMQTRALLTQDERDKIVEFLKTTH
ncbi:MAG TPA: cytochrome c [Chitinophagaceae bacterium]